VVTVVCGDVCGGGCVCRDVFAGMCLQGCVHGDMFAGMCKHMVVAQINWEPNGT